MDDCPTHTFRVHGPAWRRVNVGHKSQIKKQRHTAKRIFERLRDEHGFIGDITIVELCPGAEAPDGVGAST
jgi:hypothetical protein